eukprot:4908095-Pleurochrysis_carterae.AAC.1
MRSRQKKETKRKSSAHAEIYACAARTRACVCGQAAVHLQLASLRHERCCHGQRKWSTGPKR